MIHVIFRGAGNVSTAMWELDISNGLNIILEPIFIFDWGPIPDYGVDGSTMATNIARGIAILFQLGELFFGWVKIKLFAKNIVSWFNTTLTVVENGVLCLQIIAAGHVFYAYGIAVQNVSNGSCDMKTPTNFSSFNCLWPIFP